MKTLFSFISIILITACQFPEEYWASNGSKTEHYKNGGSLGGSSSVRTAGGFEKTENHNKSFGQGMQALTSIGGTVGIGYAKGLTAVTTRQLNASNAATANAKIAADAAAAQTAAEAALIDKAIIPASVVPVIPPLKVP